MKEIAEKRRKVLGRTAITQNFLYFISNDFEWIFMNDEIICDNHLKLNWNWVVKMNAFAKAVHFSAQIKKSSTHKIYVLLSVAGVTNKRNVFLLPFYCFYSRVEKLSWDLKKKNMRAELKWGKNIYLIFDLFSHIFHFFSLLFFFLFSRCACCRRWTMLLFLCLEARSVLPRVQKISFLFKLNLLEFS
jgi:hypothetical protein